MTKEDGRPYAELETITPQRAKEWLDKNKVNRNKRRPGISQYAADMSAGNWLVSGETVGFDVDGWLVEGQHRLLACIEADKPFETLVAYNLPRGAQDVINSGMKRSVADTLHMRGEPNTVQLAAMLRLVIAWETDHELRERATKTSNSFVLRKFDEAPELYREAARQGQGAYQVSGKMASPATWGLAWVLFAKIDAHDTEDFFEMVRTGDRLGRGDPVYALRRYLNDRVINSAGERRAAMAVIIKAWNAYRDGTRVDVLSFKAGGVAPEKMPEPK